ncbi:protein-glutamate methylesterase/protein-glutamine glutaminase [Oceanirhabdus sp. W0125-5]|uniref:protein-glutamate methylesterase/protein-glutamine glutaminase n=1 Tax=Oceanirhabdus sp. W0125-5 TaxID=2999116 RepID=UPI0022F2C986|nr:chemotaxis response regulator protein-glutamate methylesterase [Oceanirhabdus sp. W0125-5]WBW95482.1 chemotaxis response regulator protein-glutamate methylesterase [Oceanirhabdus sp. W0125-5]
MEKRKILVVDDSALMRKIISDMINEEPDLEVIDKVRNGEELFKKLETVKPDLITLDIEMPKMNGIEALKEMDKRRINIPVIVLSSVSERAKKLTIDCLHGGAFDFIEKPSGSISLDINKVKERLVEQIRAATKNKVNISYERNRSVARKVETRKVESRFLSKSSGIKKDIRAVAIGASTGGPKALYNVLTELPFRLGVPIFVVQHMPVGFTKAFAERLNANCKMKVVEGYDGCPIEKDTVYIAQGGSHMVVVDGFIRLNKEPTMWGVRPAVDKLFDSVVDEYKGKILSVVLTGMGKDGAQGTVKIKDAGGYTISEAQETCTIYGMPKAAYETGKVDEVLPLDKIADKIVSMTRR